MTELISKCSLFFAPIILSLSVGSAHALSLTNGGFESGDFTGWNQSGNVQMGGSNSSFGRPSEGSFYAYFNAGDATPNAVLSQTFTTTAGQEYFLSFDFGKLGLGGGDFQLDVLVQGANALLSARVSDGFGGQPATIDQFYQSSFVADSSSTTLSFTDTSTVTVNIDGGLDNVQVTAVPFEFSPGVGLLALGGLWGLGKASKHFKPNQKINTDVKPSNGAISASVVR